MLLPKLIAALEMQDNLLELAFSAFEIKTLKLVSVS